MQEQMIESLAEWGRKILDGDDRLELSMLKSRRDNKWFEPEQQRLALHAIATHYLNVDNLKEWLGGYRFSSINAKEVGLICAGNIPAVGFHDILSILVSGHRGLVKLSSKDAHLLPTLINILTDINADLGGRITFVEKLKGYEAVIATGSDNSARYFYEYFGHVPHLIRKNRQGIAVLDEKVTDEEILALRSDVFSYFGLGCRNVSMILLPQMFDKERLYAQLLPEMSLRDNDKYENNYNYNLAICMMEHIEFKTNDELLFIESQELHSRIASVHLAEYSDMKELEEFLTTHRDRIQCTIASSEVQLNISTVKPGDSQKPSPKDYADGMDTLRFLLEL